MPVVTPGAYGKVTALPVVLEFTYHPANAYPVRDGAVGAELKVPPVVNDPFGKDVPPLES